MTRIYVTEPDTDADGYDRYERHDDPRQPQRRAGFFTQESATYWHGNKEWDGANHADVNTRDSARGQGLYRTAQGRWVLRTWSSWQGESDTYRYTTDADARDWLLFNEYEDAVREHFGEPEEERGPGRPEIGAPIQVRLGDLRPAVEYYARERGVSQAEAIRQLLTSALEAAEVAR